MQVLVCAPRSSNTEAPPPKFDMRGHTVYGCRDATLPKIIPLCFKLGCTPATDDKYDEKGKCKVPCVEL